jgi:MATE family multidrug resistance protein
VALFHVADAAQTIAAFVLRAYRIATMPLVVYVVAVWGVGLGGGYVAAFDLVGVGPSWMRGARGFWSMATFGLAVAGHQIAANMVSMMFMLPLAIANAASTLVAQQIGAGDATDARRIGWAGLELGLAIAAVLGGAVYLLREQVVGLYTANPVIVAAALPLLAWVALFHVADAAQTIAAFVLRAYRIATMPLVVYVLAVWLVGLGGGYIAAFDLAGVSPAWMRGARGFWSMATFGLVIAGLAMTALLVAKLRREAR